MVLRFSRSPHAKLAARALWAMLCTLGPSLLSGCGALGPYLSNDVPLRYQRQQIERFDPYPDQDIGPPMVGVRPPGFDAPIPEGERAFWGVKRRSPWGF